MSREFVDGDRDISRILDKFGLPITIHSIFMNGRWFGEFNMPVLSDGLKISYLGMSSTIGELKIAGWEVKVKEGHRRWFGANNYLYLRHSKDNLIMRVKLSIRNIPGGVYWECGEIDFLTNERNSRKKSILYHEIEYKKLEMTEADIEPMMEAIIAIQAKRQKVPKELPEADILEFMRA